MSEDLIERNSPALRFMPRRFNGEALDASELQFAELVLAYEDGVTAYARNGGDFAPIGMLRRKILEAFRGEHRAAYSGRREP